MTTRRRLTIFLILATAISSLAFFVIKLAQGYRPDLTTKTLRPTGLLVATSTPDGAQLWLNSQLKSATNTTLNLPPGEYQVEIKKDGFTSWQKTLSIKKELVVQTDAHLFSTYPDLKALTFTGATRPLPSPDGQKVFFAVSGASLGKNGLWVLDLADRPLGLSRQPRLIITSAPGGRDFAQSEYHWSPDSKQILMTLTNRPGPGGKTSTENFLLETDRLNSAVNLVDISASLPSLLERWQEEETIRQNAQLSKLPEELLEVFEASVADIQFAPDENKIFYTATASATIPEEIISPLPAANSQPEEREIKPGRVYVYDLKEDRNFFIMEAPALPDSTVSPKVAAGDRSTISPTSPISWFPTSKHLFLLQKGKISIIEYDGTNLIDVYSGPFEDSFAFPFPDSRRILVLTAVSQDAPPNLYAISLR